MSEKVSALPRNRRAKFKFIDLFAGIGGMRLGFESVGGKCVYSSEWDESCKKTYAGIGEKSATRVGNAN